MKRLLVLFGVIILFLGVCEMPTYTSGLAKGLSEPISPYRSDYCFGAELGDFNADGWNAIPNLWDAETDFDLSTITFNHEVVVALTGITNPNIGEFTITHKWYRNSDGQLIFSCSHTWDGAYSWCYFYSFIGWVAGEITQNGDYHVDVEVTGVNTYSTTLNFTISGIPPGGMPGHIWVEGTELHFITPITGEKKYEGTDTGNNGTAGFWVEGDYLHYIDAYGDERREIGSYDGYFLTNKGGYIWIEGDTIHYIGEGELALVGDPPEIKTIWEERHITGAPG